MLRKLYLEILRFYIYDMIFRIKRNDDYSKGGVLQGSIFGTVLYTVYNSDILTTL